MRVTLGGNMIAPFQPQIGGLRSEENGFSESAWNTSPAHIVILSQAGTILFGNAAWRQLVATSASDLPDDGIGMEYLSVCRQSAGMKLPPATLVADGLDELAAGRRELLELEYKDGTGTFLLRARCFGWRQERRLIVAHENIVVRNRPQRHTDDYDLRTQEFLDQISDAILTLAANGEILSCNTLAERIFGFSKGELRGMFFSHLQSGDPNFENTLNQLERRSQCRLIGRNRNGGLFPIQVLSVDQMKRQGRAFYTIIVRQLSSGMLTATDELPIDKLLEKLREERDQRKLKEQCISMMSHELRTPLASIQLSHDMLAQYSERATPEERQKFLDNIRLQVKHLNEIVSDVVNLSRSHQANADFHPVAQDLVAFCRDIIESFAITYQRTHQVTFECAHDEIMATFDWKLLRRALTNLLGNAIKYSPAGGPVRFHLWRDSDCAHMTITDEGIGIPAKDIDFLFLAFHRAANVGSLPGTGLGLAITKQALDRHEGEIRFSSEINIGTTVEVDLPLRLIASSYHYAKAPESDGRQEPISLWHSENIGSPQAS